MCWGSGDVGGVDVGAEGSEDVGAGGDFAIDSGNAEFAGLFSDEGGDSDFSGFGEDDHNICGRIRGGHGLQQSCRSGHSAGHNAQPLRHSIPIDDDDDYSFAAVDGEEWSEDLTPPVLIPFTDQSRILVVIPPTILGFLLLFITRELLKVLLTETNSYANYMRNEMGRQDQTPWILSTSWKWLVSLALSL